MGDEWVTTKWGSLVELKYGKSLKGYKDSDGEFPVYGTNGAVGRCNLPLCEYPSIIIGRKGAYRGVHYSPTPFYVIDTAFYIEPKTDINLKWAYYSLLTQDINGLDSGSAIPSTRREDFYALQAKVPPHNIQDAIVKHLDALNSKIELNRQMNTTLEAMAQALFKSWFVDFDPVIDKALAAGNSIPEPLRKRAEARQALGDKRKPLPADIAQHFPDRFVFNEEMGWVPEGWEVMLSGKIIDVRDGTHDSPKQAESGYPLVTSKHITSGTLKLKDAYLISDTDYEKVNKRSKVEHGDILLTMIGTVGVPYLVMHKEVHFAIKNIGLFRTSQAELVKFYFFFLLKTLGMKNYLDARVAGTTQKYLSLKVLRNIEFILPKEQVLHSFNGQLSEWMNKMRELEKESSTLAAICDTLLPKLLSGQLRIPNAENFFKDA
jgi:type I restriction enzyme S subunit